MRKTPANTHTLMKKFNQLVNQRQKWKEKAQTTQIKIEELEIRLGAAKQEYNHWHDKYHKIKREYNIAMDVIEKILQKPENKTHE